MRFRSILTAVLLGMVAFGAIGRAADRKLEVWIMQTGNPDGAKAVLNRVNDQFNKAHPGVKVNISWIPWAGAQQKFLTSIIGGMAPDVAEVGTTWNPDFAAMEALENIKPYVVKWGQKKDLNPALLENATYNGRLYGLPWYAGNRAVYYRKDWFAAAGIKKFPVTWTEFAKVAKRLTVDTNNDGKIDRYGFSVNGASQHEFLPLIWMNKGEIVVKTAKGWKAAIDSPASRQALQWFADLYTKYKVSPEGSTAWNALSSRKAFETGAQAMIIDVAGLVPKFLANPELKDKFAVAPLPYSKQPASFVGGSNLVLFSQSKKKRLGWEYMQLLLEKENQLAWAEAVSFFPARMSLLKEAKFAQDPYLSVFAAEMKHSRVYPPIPQWGEIENSKLLIKMMQQIMLKRRTVKQATAEAAKAMDAVLRKKK
jgi:N,N'-diacetylchitobiose transport system substrate-binding protein